MYPRTSDLEFFKARNRTDSGDDLFGNFARSLAQLPSEFESKRQRILAKFDFRRLLDDDVRVFQAVSATQKFAQMFDQSPFQISIQECPLTNAKLF